MLRSTRWRLPNQVYVDEFAQLYGQPVPAMPITIGPLEPGTAGKCYIPGDKGTANQVADSFFGASTQAPQRIVISQSYFRRHSADHDKIQVVVFHELGHCILRRAHRDDMVTTDYGLIPRSIMHPKGTFGGEPFYRKYFDRYVDELFGAAKRYEETEATLAATESNGAWTGLSPCVEVVPVGPK